MNIIEAVRTGKPFKRKDWDNWWCFEDGDLVDEYGNSVGYSFKFDDFLADDWEVKEDELLVPESINIESRVSIGSGDELGIVFNGNKQVLFYNFGVWRVMSSHNEDFIKCKLVPVKKKDLKVGYTYFMSMLKNPDFKDLLRYCKYLGKGKYVYTNGQNVFTDNDKWNHWWQVVPIKEER